MRLPFIKKLAQSKSKKQIFILKFMEYVNKNFPKTIKIRETYGYNELYFLKENQLGAVIFDVKYPHKPIALIIDFDDNFNIINITPLDRRSENNLNKIINSKRRSL